MFKQLESDSEAWIKFRITPTCQAKPKGTKNLQIEQKETLNSSFTELSPKYLLFECLYGTCSKRIQTKKRQYEIYNLLPFFACSHYWNLEVTRCFLSTKDSPLTVRR